MPTPTPDSAYFLKYDPTGTSSDNLINLEYHLTPSGQVSILRCDYGLFFKEGFSISWKNPSNQLFPMVPGTDYSFIEYDAKVSGPLGKEVYKAILITNLALPGTYAVSYQALGGPDNPNINRIWNDSHNGESQVTPVNFDDIESKPDFYPPAAHTHDARDVYGAEYLKAILLRLKVNAQQQLVAYAATGAPSKDAEITDRVNNFRNVLEQAAFTLNGAISAHIGNADYPHTYSKVTIGLGNVVNGDFVSAVDGNGTQLPVYAHPEAVAVALQTIPQPTSSTHPSRTDNPHGLTAARMGMGNVINAGFYEQYVVLTHAYQALFANGATKKYVTPFVAANSLTEALADNYQLYWVTPKTALEAVNGPIDVLSDQLQATEVVVAAAVAAVDAATAAVADAQEQVATAQQANLRFALLEAGASYAATLRAVMNYDYGRAAVGSSVALDGMYPLPEKLDNLALWLDFDNSKNVYETDTNGVKHLMRLTDRSPSARVYSARNFATAPVMAASRDIADGRVGFSENDVAHFTPGVYMTQIYGDSLSLQTGMTVIVMGRTSDSNLPLFALMNLSDTPQASVVVQPRAGVALELGTPTWNAMTAAPDTINANESTIVVGSVADVGESQGWYAGCKPVPVTTYPRGTNTAVSAWPADYARSAVLNVVGNPSTVTPSSGELAHVIVYNRQLSMAEVKAVVDYLRLAESKNLAFVVDYSAGDAF